MTNVKRKSTFALQEINGAKVVPAGGEADVQVTWDGDVGEPGTQWSSSNPALARVNVDAVDSTKAHVVATGPGPVQIHATANLGDPPVRTVCFFDLIVVDAAAVGGAIAVLPEEAANMPPTVMSCTPTEGDDGTEVTIEGGGFQAQGEHSQVKVGYENATVTAWDDAKVVVNAVQGQNVPGAPLAVWLRTDDKQDVNAGAFTFLLPVDARSVQNINGDETAEAADHAKRKHR